MDPSLLTRALAGASLLFTCEATLARMAQQPVPALDLLWSALGITVLCALPALVALRTSDEPQHAEALAASGVWVAAGLVASAVALPTALVPAGIQATVGILIGMAFALAAPRLGFEGPPPCVGLLVGLIAAWIGSWVLSGEAPPVGTALVVGAVWSAAAGLCSWPQLAPLAAGLGGVVSGGMVLTPPTPWQAAGTPPDAPDIVLITVDTLRADVGSTLPGFQRVALAGAALPDTTAAAPWTLPSTATLLTGAPLHEHHAGRTPSGTNAIATTVPTLAERLSERGYDTMAVVDRNMWLRPSSGVDRGFAWFFHTTDKARGGATATTGAPFFARLASRAGLPGRSDLAAERLVDRALDGLQRRQARPLFLWLHFMDVHLPYTHSDDAFLRQANRDAILADPEWSTEAGRATLMAAHTHEATLVDAAIGRLLDHLPDDAVVVYTADHGEELWEHGGFEHGHALWQEVIAVPLAIQGLAIAQPAAPTHHLDIAPTLLSAAGASIEGLPGRDLATAASETTRMTGNLAHGAPDRMWSVRRGPHKAIVGEDGAHLYNLTADPHERNDLARQRPELLAELAAERWSNLGTGGVPIELERDQKSELEALGYLDGEAP